MAIDLVMQKNIPVDTVVSINSLCLITQIFLIKNKKIESTHFTMNLSSQNMYGAGGGI
jgi:hypothetical protein